MRDMEGSFNKAHIMALISGLLGTAVVCGAAIWIVKIIVAAVGGG